MTNNQLFFAIAGLMVTLFGLAMAFFKYYIDAKIDGKIDGLEAKIDGKIDGLEAKMDAKIDSLAQQVRLLVDYMILHQGKIATLEERTKHL